MRWSAALFIIPVAFLSLGSTDCDQFREVTVPRTDSQPPMAVGSAYRIYLGGQLGQFSAEALAHRWETDAGTLYRYSGPEMPLLAAVATSLDDGGARRARLTYVSEYECCRLSGGSWSACVRTSLAEATIEEHQEGTVGSRVSNGVYASALMQPPVCPSGKKARRVSFEFQVRAWDFDGNQSVSGPHRILYDATVD
jgi:hypothetical protein